MGDSRRTAYLIAGAGGMLGTALARVLTESGARFFAPPEGGFDITDEAAVTRAVAEFVSSLDDDERGVLVNAAAYTNVERAQDEPDIAYRVNEGGAAILASAAVRNGLRFVHVSTDFVFDGKKQGAYAEDDATAPLSVYGASKLAGEIAVAAAAPDALIVRTAWVYGAGGANFPVKVIAAAKDRGSLSVVTDEVGSPTYTVDLAGCIVALEATGASSLYHLVGSGSCSRYELASEVLRLAGIDVPVEPVTSDAFPTKAARPANSVLDCSKAAVLGIVMPDWKDGLARFIAESGHLAG